MSFLQKSFLTFCSQSSFECTLGCARTAHGTIYVESQDVKCKRRPGNDVGATEGAYGHRIIVGDVIIVDFSSALIYFFIEIL